MVTNMKGKKQKNKKIFLLLTLVIGLVIGAAFLVKAFYQPTKTYHSDFLKITIDYPTDFKLEEKFGTISLKNNKGEIIVTSIGTNTESLEEYIEEFENRKKKPYAIDKKVVNINNIEAIQSFNTYPDSPKLNNKAYFFYRDFSIIHIYTMSSDLYPELDHIVESFRYEP